MSKTAALALFALIAATAADADPRAARASGSVAKPIAVSQEISPRPLKPRPGGALFSDAAPTIQPAPLAPRRKRGGHTMNPETPRGPAQMVQAAPAAAAPAALSAPNGWGGPR